MIVTERKLQVNAVVEVQSPVPILPGCYTVDFGDGKMIIVPSLKDATFVSRLAKFNGIPKFYAADDVWIRDDPKLNI